MDDGFTAAVTREVVLGGNLCFALGPVIRCPTRSRIDRSPFRLAIRHDVPLVPRHFSDPLRDRLRQGANESLVRASGRHLIRLFEA